MVVSSACMTTAKMMQAVIAGRLTACGAAPASAMTVPRRSEPSGQEARQAPLMVGGNAELDAHAHAQLRLAGRIGDTDAQRDALHHLDPVAAGIFGRQQREARRRCR